MMMSHQLVVWAKHLMTVAPFADFHHTLLAAPYVTIGVRWDLSNSLLLMWFN